MIFFVKLPAHPVKTGQARWGRKIIHSLCSGHLNGSSFLGQGGYKKGSFRETKGLVREKSNRTTMLDGSTPRWEISAHPYNGTGCFSRLNFCERMTIPINPSPMPS